MLVQQSLIPIFASNSSTVAVLIVEPWITIQLWFNTCYTYKFRRFSLLWPSKVSGHLFVSKTGHHLVTHDERATADASGLIRHRLYVQRNCHKRKTTQHIKQNSTLAGFLQRRVADFQNWLHWSKKGESGGNKCLFNHAASNP